MKFGVNTFLWADSFDRSHIGLLSQIKKGGFDGVEIPLFQPDAVNDPELKSALRDSGLEVTVCSVLPSPFNTVDQDKSVRQQTKEHLRRCIVAVASINAKVIAGPLYAPVGYLPGRRRTQDEWQYAVEAFTELGSVLDDHDVTLAIEPLNRYETYFLNTTADAVALCRAIDHPRIGILFDTYHANIEEKNVAASIEEAGTYLRHFHSCENDRGVPGTGHVDWPGVFRALTQIGYDGWLTIEGFGFSVGAISAAASIWRDLAPSSDAIAFEGLRFLRQAA